MSPGAFPRTIELAHALPGRARFRLSWLHAGRRRNHDEVARLADELTRVPGMREVAVHPYTGSVLCLYDPARLDPETLAARLLHLAGADRVLPPGETARAAPLPAARGESGSVAREMVRLFRDLDDRILAATDGKVDLGTVATLGFFAAGAIGVAARGSISGPPWFNLAWWGFRTFMTVERNVLDGTDDDDAL